MPNSSAFGKNLIDRMVLRITKQLPTSFFKSHLILDLGAGSGAYSDRYSKTHLRRPKFRWVGVEIWEPYKEKFALDQKYDALHTIDVCEYLSPEWSDPSDKKFDITFIGGLLEHLPKDKALQLVNDALSISQVVIVSLHTWPKADSYNSADGNPYQTPVESWTNVEAMATLPNIVFWGSEVDTCVYVLSKNPTVAEVLKPQIGVYGICKNEIEFVKRCYSSIDHADFITICDTGSDDGTWEALVEMVKQRTVDHGHEEDLEIYKVKVNDVEEPWMVTDGQMSVYRISIQPWRFDDARNAALALLPEELDMCISIDMDELMEKGWKEALEDVILTDLRAEGRVNDRFNHRFSTIWNWKEVEESGGAIAPNASEHWHERIHARKGFRWKLPVHEVLIKGDGTPETHKFLGGIKMIQKPDNAKSRAWYTPMIKKAIEEDPKRWKLHSFLASDLIATGQYDEAIRVLNTARGLDDADKAFITLQLSNVYRAMGRHDESMNELSAAVMLAPHLREYKVYLARLYLERGKVSEAKCFYELAKAQTTKTSGYQYDGGCWDEAFEAELKRIPE